jgi:hypothetical protein
MWLKLKATTAARALCFPKRLQGWSLLRFLQGDFGDRMAKVIQLLGEILPKVLEIDKVFRT